MEAVIAVQLRSSEPSSSYWILRFGVITSCSARANGFPTYCVRIADNRG